MAVLSTAFLAAVVIACILGTRTYQAQRAATASLHPAAALLLQVAPAAAAGARPRWPRRAGLFRVAVSSPAY